VTFITDGELYGLTHQNCDFVPLLQGPLEFLEQYRGQKLNGKIVSARIRRALAWLTVQRFSNTQVGSDPLWKSSNLFLFSSGYNSVDLIRSAWKWFVLIVQPLQFHDSFEVWGESRNMQMRAPSNKDVVNWAAMWPCFARNWAPGILRSPRLNDCLMFPASAKCR